MKKLILILALFIPSLSEAAWHLYVTPVIGSGTDTYPRRPKYILELKVRYQAYYYGRQPYTIVAADLSAVQDTALKANSDVLAIPDNLDQQIGAGALAIVQNALESRGIPGNWLTSTTTYRTLLRIIIGMARLLQRYAIISGKLTPLVTVLSVLDLQFQQLDPDVQEDLIITAKDLGLNLSEFTASNTLRQILKAVGDQMANTQWTLGGINI